MQDLVDLLWSWSNPRKMGCTEGFSEVRGNMRRSVLKKKITLVAFREVIKS